MENMEDIKQMRKLEDQSEELFYLRKEMLIQSNYPT